MLLVRALVQRCWSRRCDVQNCMPPARSKARPEFQLNTNYNFCHIAILWETYSLRFFALYAQVIIFFGGRRWKVWLIISALSIICEEERYIFFNSLQSFMHYESSTKWTATVKTLKFFFNAGSKSWTRFSVLANFESGINVFQLLSRCLCSYSIPLNMINTLLLAI